MEDAIDITLINDEIIRIFGYAAFGFLTAMVLTPIYTHFAYKYKWWKKPRDTATTGEKASVFSKLHALKHKRNIPTMAGLISIAATAVVTITIGNLSREQTYLPLAAMFGAGMVGLADDIINLRGVGSGVAGLSTRIKFLSISAVAAIGGWFIYSKLGYDSFHLTFVGDIGVGWLMIPIFIFVVVATANAVNISDGLDGLAGGLLVSAYTAMGFIAFMQNNLGIAAFCLTVVGTLLSYVWFNIHPARFFMGDVGSFALGTSLGVIAMLTDTLILLPIIGIVFVVEAGSSALQIASKKLRGKKIFKSAPIHHHFEAMGWPETKVTMRFWIIGQVAGAAGIMLAILGGHI
jgi:phospho-N-acetylmuramoyl-pentapeptide-transferase